MRQKDEHFIKALKKTPCNKSGKIARNPNETVMEILVRNTEKQKLSIFYFKSLLFSVFKCSSVDDYMNSHDGVSTAVDIATQVITILKRWLCYFFDLDFDFKFRLEHSCLQRKTTPIWLTSWFSQWIQ